MGWEAAAHSASAERQSRKFFSLKGKNKKEMARAKIIRKIFCFVRHKASAAAGWGCRPAGGNQKSASGFSLKKVRISFNRWSQIVCWCSAASALRASAGRFANIFQGFLKETKTFRFRKMRFAVAKQQNPALRDSQSFFSPVRASCKAIISAKGGLRSHFTQKRY